MGLVLLALGGCTFFESGSDWSTQVEPGGPCYAFNFLDGVEAGSNAEFHSAFACLNRQGMVEPLSPLDVALDAPTRSGNVGGNLVELMSAAGNASDVSLAGVLDSVLGAFDDREGAERVLRLALELVYASGIDELGTAVSLNSETSLGNGLLVPLVETAGFVAATILDDDRAALGPVSDVLRSQETRRWLWTLALLEDAPDADVAALATLWPSIAAQVIERTSDSSNDMDPGETSNSLRDLVTSMLAGDAVLDVAGAAEPILDDTFTRDQLAAWVQDENAAGRWENLGDGVLYLASVDPNGGALSAGEDSALVALVRLFHDTNQPVECTIDLWVTDVHIDLGNLAVAILQTLAQTDPGTAANGVDLLGDTLGLPLTDAALQTLADSGVCPVIDDQVVSDLSAIDRLSDPATDDLLVSLLGLLAAADDHIDSIADVATAMHDDRLVDPLEEVLYDVGGTSASREILAAVPGLLDPDRGQATDEFPAGVRPVDFDAVCDLVQEATAQGNYEALSPVINVAVGRESTWTAMGNATHLLTTGGTETSGALGLLRESVEADPELAFLDTTADYVDDPAVATSALELVESPDLRGAITSTELSSIGPLPWLAELYVGGTVDALWNTIELFRPLLGGSDV